MKNFIKLFLICKMVLISFSQNSEAGIFASKEEVDESDQSAHVSRQPNIDPEWPLSSYLYDTFEGLQQNFYSFPSRPISPSFKNNHDPVNPSTLNDNDIPIPVHINFEEVANQHMAADNKPAEQKQTITAAKRDKEETQPNLLNPFPQANTKKKKREKKQNPGTTNVLQQTLESKVVERDYTDQIALGQQSAICLPQRPLKETIPTVEGLIQTVIQNKIEKPVKVHMSLNRAELSDFHKAFRVLVGKYPFPFTWSTENKGPSKEEPSSYILELSLASQANEREKVEKKFVYQVSQEDEKKVNWPYVFDVAMRSELTLEDFKFNNSIKIRMIALKGNTEAQDLQEFQQFLEQRLPKDNNPLHILGITFNSKTKGHYDKMYDVFLRKISHVNVGYHSRGIVFDSQNGFLYLCLDNNHRKMLDLHGGRSVKQAEQETQDFIMQAYQTFNDDVIVLTGLGNHVNPSGKKGVLKAAFGEWMQNEHLLPLIENYSLIEGGGGYKVIFKKIRNLNLKNKNHKNSVLLIKNSIAQMAQQKQTRLRILLNPGEEYNREFNLMTAVYADLYKNNNELAKLITPISFESTPGEMKIIFNMRHPKSISYFTFANNYGTTSVFGTIQ